MIVREWWDETNEQLTQWRFNVYGDCLRMTSYRSLLARKSIEHAREDLIYVEGELWMSEKIAEMIINVFKESSYH